MTITVQYVTPHKAARAAMWLYSTRYGLTSGSRMEFWNSLSEQERNLCREMVKNIDESPVEA